MQKNRKIGILLFNEVEVLDFAGPFEVFSYSSFNVKTVAETKNFIRTRNGLTVYPDYDFNDAPNFDILIVPGGYGAEQIEIHNSKVINWIKNRREQTEIIASVCTGAFLLAEAGLLNGKKVTTHWMDIDRLEKEYPEVILQRGVKYVDQGSIITSGGISAGINMSFYLVKKLMGEDVAKATAKAMVYDIDIESI